MMAFAEGRIVVWIRADIDRACAALVSTVLGGVALAGSATHVLHVGAYPTVDVTGWMVWTVAGSLEVLAAYAAWEMRRRRGRERLLPGIVFVLSVGFIVLANLAASDPVSWAAGLPWAEAFAVAPPVSFVSVAAIAETRGWGSGRSRRRRVDTAPPRVTTARRQRVGRRDDTEIGQRIVLAAVPAPDAVTWDAVTREVAAPDVSGPMSQGGESRADTVRRWLREGHAWKVMMQAGVEQFGVSESTMKREIREARNTTNVHGGLRP
ncbi:hypothetical protein KIH74_34145 [Kineosporia sp. J2-2]|uniref:DUF2637 domain-containing protein n=1 Tax=Kineosporia corallincola TaxID=2835133 RepID=A0ABS5TTA4_9ACTN|nr:hypothetical protein [Kineosporia corallincola]MBT0774037.1 hypothetical protein [Kineosporia corallincola]